MRHLHHSCQRVPVRLQLGAVCRVAHNRLRLIRGSKIWRGAGIMLRVRAWLRKAGATPGRVAVLMTGGGGHGRRGTALLGRVAHRLMVLRQLTLTEFLQ